MRRLGPRNPQTAHETAHAAPKSPHPRPPTPVSPIECGWLLEGAGEGLERGDWLWDQDPGGLVREVLIARGCSSHKAILGGTSPRKPPERKAAGG